MTQSSNHLLSVESTGIVTIYACCQGLGNANSSFQFIHNQELLFITKKKTRSYNAKYFLKRRARRRVNLVNIFHRHFVQSNDSGGRFMDCLRSQTEFPHR